MVITMWSVKGGSGVSTLCTVVAAALNGSSPESALLVDMGDGDLRGMLSGDSPGVQTHVVGAESGTGFCDWVVADETLDPSALQRLISTHPTPLLTGGNSNELFAHQQLNRLTEGLDWLATQYAHVVIDAGSPGSSLRTSTSTTTINAAALSVLVLRPCLLSLRKAVASTLPATAAVLLGQPGSTLRASDIESSLGIPVVATIPFSPPVNRATESSRLFSHPPRAIKRSIRPLLALIHEFQPS
jgi:Mrp family chromosome partitioning ATPase